MVFIDVPTVNKKESFIGDGSTFDYTIADINPTDIHILVSGIYLTEFQDYTISGSTISIIEAPLLDENINIIYKI